MALSNLYNTTVDVLRLVRTSDSMGGATEIEKILHNNLRCRINWVRGSEKIFTSKDTWFRDAKLFCAVVDIQVRDRIRYKSKTYEVVNVSDTDNAGKFLTVEIRLVA